MRPSASLGHLATIFLGFSTLSAAWPGFLPPVDALVARQEGENE